MPELGTFLISVFHVHDGTRQSITSGVLCALDGDDAAMRSRFWVNRKMGALGCRKPGNRCHVSVTKISSSEGSRFLVPTAEEIDTLA
jgi:hypothetical protein